MSGGREGRGGSRGRWERVRASLRRHRGQGRKWGDVGAIRCVEKELGWEEVGWHGMGREPFTFDKP